MNQVGTLRHASNGAAAGANWPGIMAWPGRFVATIWLALAVIAISALAPSGLAQSKSHGSAFSPATFQVALNALGTRARPAVKKAQLDNDPDMDGAEAPRLAPIAFATAGSALMVARAPVDVALRSVRPATVRRPARWEGQPPRQTGPPAV